MIRILLADDHPVVRAGLRQILADAPDVSVVGEAADGTDVIRVAAGLQPDVVLLDITMPGGPFLTLLRTLKRNHPRTGVLVLSVHPEEQYAIRALRGGADGYLSKERSPDLLLEAVRKVAQGQTYMPASVAHRLAAALRGGSVGEPHEALSGREYEVLCLMGAGKTVKQIAGHLGLSPKTVSTFRARILQKMGLHTNAELVRYAVEHALEP
jgi:two-component system, NarL family, invasion response regulator UvrY